MKKFLFFIVMLAFVNANAADIYVSTLGSDTNDGLSWSTAKSTLAGAYSVSGTNTIYIAAGTYDIAAAVSVGKVISFYGGYLVDYVNNTATRPLKAGGKSWEFDNETILNGVLFTGANTDSKNSKLIHIGGSAAGNVVIDGITFQNGQGKFTSSNELGGAISQSTGSTLVIKLSNCIFKNNSVTKKDYSSGGMGGAVYLKESAEVTDCYFYGNSATIGSSGGGALFSQPAASTSVIKISGCLFEENSSNVSGGAIRTNGVNKTIIENCIFVNNIAYDETTTTLKNGAALYCAGTASGTLAPSTDEINNCLFYNNEGATGIILSGATMKNCTYVNNIGALRTGYEGAGKIYNTVLWGNKDIDGTTSIGFHINKVPEAITNCATDVELTGDYITNLLTLNVSNTVTDGPNFKTPTTIVGNGDLSEEAPDWGILVASPLKASGLLANAPAGKDLAGTDRPSTGTNCSIGAYEYVVDTATDLHKDALNVFISLNNKMLTVSHDTQVSVKILNITGQEIDFSPAAFSYSVQLKTGVYIVSVKDATGKSSVSKIIVK